MKAKKSSILVDVSDRSLPAPGSTSYEGQSYDIMLHAWMSRYFGPLSPAAIRLATFDWLIHFYYSPAKQADLIRKGWKEVLELGLYTYECQINSSASPCAQPRSSDTRFKNDLWQKFPFNLYAQSFLLTEKWFNSATNDVRGVSRHHLHLVNFITRQLLDVIAPSNFPATNPEVINQAFLTGGMNLVKGFNNLIEDFSHHLHDLPPVGTEKFKVGVDVAVTPGKVIFRNRLIELIQYEPTTTEVYAEPVLIIPAWIMKYYILDLSPHNSLVKYLVDHGHTVFMISWKNPDSQDRDLGLEEYLNLGIMNAVDVINQIIPQRGIHAVGYCLGGTLLMIAAAAMANKADNRIKSITLFAAQVDFKDAGDLSLFVDQSQITYLEDIMWEKGYLGGSHMSGAFSMLHSNDLIWSRMVHDYLLGNRRTLNDLMAWDTDTTRLPYKMHSEYLHSLFLNNDLAQGRFKVNRKKIALIDISLPIFVVATVKDHVSPWRSVYKVHLYTDTEVTFVLTNGGHNAGIVSEPNHKGRMFQMSKRNKGDKYITTETWHERVPEFDGSWWPVWEDWLVSMSSEKVTPPPLGNAEKDFSILCDAPGTYVLQK